MTNVICLGGTVSYAYFSEDGTVTIPVSTLSSDVLKTQIMFADAVRALNYSIILRRKNPRVTLNPDSLKAFIYELAKCFLYTERVPQVDFDYVKHAIYHFRYILL